MLSRSRCDCGVAFICTHVHADDTVGLVLCASQRAYASARCNTIIGVLLHIGPDSRNIGPDRRNIGPDNKNIRPDNRNIGPDRRNIGPVWLTAYLR